MFSSDQIIPWQKTDYSPKPAGYVKAEEKHVLHQRPLHVVMMTWLWIKKEDSCGGVNKVRMTCHSAENRRHPARAYHHTDSQHFATPNKTQAQTIISDKAAFAGFFLIFNTRKNFFALLQLFTRVRTLLRC